MKTFYPLRRRDESAWSEYVTHQTAGIERKYRKRVRWAKIWGVVAFVGMGAIILHQPIAYFVARFWR